MAEDKFGVSASTEAITGKAEFKVGEKTTGEKALEAIPIAGSAIKAIEAAGTAGETGGFTGLMSEGQALVGGLTGAAQGLAMDPIGWMVGQGLEFLISVVQPLEDWIHYVSGDGPALQQAGENFGAIAAAVAKQKETFVNDLSTTVQSWGGDAAEAAGTRLGEFAHGIDGVAVQASELAESLMMSSMIMQIIEDAIKAILTELIIWLAMIWIPALAAAVPSCGGSLATAGALTAPRVASTAGRVAGIVAKLKALLAKLVEFLRNLGTRAKKLGKGFTDALAERKAGVADADAALTKTVKEHGRKSREWLIGSAGNKLNSSKGMVGERLNHGFWKSMGEAIGNEALAQINPQHEKGLRNTSIQQKADEYGQAGENPGKQRIEGYLDI